MHLQRLILTLLLTLGVLGCGGDTSTTANPDQKILHVGNRSEVEDLDPHLVTGIAEFRALSALFEGLATVDPATSEAVPAAAESWTLSDDGLVYTFTLRKDGAWSNSDPVTAHDFVYAWQRMLSPALGAEYAYLLHCLDNGKAYNEGTLTDFNEVGAKALDEHTLQVTLAHPTPYFLTMQAHYAWFPIHKATIEAHGTMTQRGSTWTRPGNHVSNGPFKLHDWLPDEVLEVTANPNYWNSENVQLDGIAFYPLSNEQTEERSFRTGKLHMTYSIPMFKIDTYKAEQPELLQIHPYLQSYYYRFNCSRPPFDDVRVRQAFGLAIDRERLVRDVLKGGESPAYAFTPPNTAGYTSTHQVSTDATAAKALLAEAGYPNGEGFPTVEILYNTAEADKIIAEAMQSMWKEVLGVDVGLYNQDYKVYLASMSALDYDIARSTWLGDVIHPLNFLECFLAGGGNNRTGWKSADFDAAIQAAYAEVDTDQRNAHLHQAEKILLEEAAITPVFYQTQKFLLDPRVTGFKANIQGIIRWDQLGLSDPPQPVQ